MKYTSLLLLINLFYTSNSYPEEFGEKIYQDSCANCHENELLRAPNFSALKLIGKEGLLNSLTNGSMQEVGNTLKEEELIAVINFLSPTEKNNSRSSTDLNFCEYTQKNHKEALWNGWGNDKNNSRFQKKTSITKENVNKLNLSWAFGFEDSVRVRSQPLITSDTIYIGTQSGKVYALSLSDGCIFWSFRAKAEVRGAVLLSEDKKSIFFSDFEANIYRLDAITGKEVWVKNISDHHATTITGSMAIHNGNLFIPLSSTEIINAIDPNYECCTFRGGVIALDSDEGNLLWRMYTVPEPKKTIKNSKGTEMWGPSGAPVWSTPTIDTKRQLLYIGVGQNYSHPANDLSDAVLAIKLSSGEIVWHYQTIKEDVWNAACVTNKVNCPGQYGPDLDIGASVILVNSKDGSDVLLVGQKSGMVYALDPESAGTVLWKKRIGRGGKKGGVHWGMTADSEDLYVPIADIPEKINTEHPPQPGIHSVTIKDGQKKWYKPAPPICLSEEFKCYSSYSAAASSAEDMVIVGSMNGAIEIISSYDGELLWSYNTAKEFQTINNIPANGGSIDSDGPILAGKHLVVTSGYDIYGQITGNVLLVFSSEE